MWDYPDVPERSSEGAASLAVDELEDNSSALCSSSLLSRPVRTPTLVGVWPDRLLPRPSSETTLLSEWSVLGLFVGLVPSEILTRFDES